MQRNDNAPVDAALTERRCGEEEGAVWRERLEARLRESRGLARQQRDILSPQEQLDLGLRRIGVCGRLCQGHRLRYAFEDHWGASFWRTASDGPNTPAASPCGRVQ